MSPAPRSFGKIHVSLYREYFQEVLAALKEIGVADLEVEAGRSLQLGQKRGLAKLLAHEQPIDEEAVSTLSFLAPPAELRSSIEWLVGRLGLGSPGRGSIYSKEIELLGAHGGWREPHLRVPPSPPRMLREDLAAIACVVQKGEANDVARIGLTTGTAIPVVAFGTGTGLRNRMGAWRILVPAEKEIATLVMESSEAEEVMDMMIDAGQLDQPGRGFIFLYPVSHGVLDTKFHVGSSVSQAASVEQIVAAIDEIKGSAEWRRKTIAGYVGGRKRSFLTDLVDLTVVCNEGFCERFTQVAMAAGAPGATYRRLRHLALDEAPGPVSPAREISVMTLARGQVGAIALALESEGLFLPEHAGEIQINRVEKACTYLGG